MVIEIKGDDNSSPTVERSRGFQNTIRNNPNTHLIKSFKGTSCRLIQKNAGFLRNQSLYVFTFNDELAAIAWQVARMQA